MAYSGKCYLSSMIGGRSGNRGMCAQPCRKLYKAYNEEGYLLSPKDQLLGKEEIMFLKKNKVDSIKIEGRMKSPIYIYEAVKYYRAILDEKHYEENISKLFNRGYAKGYFYGVDKDLINKLYSSDRGYKIGEIINNKTIKLSESIMLGDGISYIDKDKNIIGGDYINQIIKDENKVKEAKRNDIVGLRAIPNGTVEIYKNFDKFLNDNILREVKQKKRKKAIKGEINIITGSRIILKFYADDISVEVNGDVVEEARNKILNVNEIYEKIGELGETSFFLQDLSINYDEKGFATYGNLKKLRREAIIDLEKKLLEKYRRKNIQNKYIISSSKREVTIPEITAYVQNEDQYKIVKNAGIKKIYRKNEFIITEKSLSKVKSTNLISNYYFLQEEKETKSLDWDINVINSYNLKYLEKYKNIDTVYLSPEISFEEIKNLKNQDMRLGLIVYGRIRLMYIEADIFDSEYLEIENDNKDLLFVRKNANKNIEIYTAVPINILDKIEDLGKYGIDEVRLDFTFETEKEILEIIKNIENYKGRYNSYNYEKGVL